VGDAAYRNSAAFLAHPRKRFIITQMAQPLGARFALPERHFNFRQTNLHWISIDLQQILLIALLR
jgi:hypothetical protein